MKEFNWMTLKEFLKKELSKKKNLSVLKRLKNK